MALWLATLAPLQILALGIGIGSATTCVLAFVFNPPRRV